MLDYLNTTQQKKLHIIQQKPSQPMLSYFYSIGMGLYCVGIDVTCYSSVYTAMLAGSCHTISCSLPESISAQNGKCGRHGQIKQVSLKLMVQMSVFGNKEEVTTVTCKTIILYLNKAFTKYSNFKVMNMNCRCMMSADDVDVDMFTNYMAGNKYVLYI